jgi:AraC family transcriptional activator of pobA
LARQESEMNDQAREAISPIPSVDFYGNEETWPTSERLYSEPLVERSAEHDWTIRAHRHRNLTQIFVLLEGNGIARLDSTRYDIAAPSVLVIPERCVHEFEWSRDCSGYVLSITSSLVARLGRKIGRYGEVLSRTSVRHLDQYSDDAAGLMRRIHDEYLGDAPLRDLSLETVLIELSVMLARLSADQGESGRQPGRSGRHFRRFVRLVETQHREQWGVSRYANVLGISAPHLNSLCKRYSGRTAKRLIHDRVLLAARRGLAYTDNSVGAIARELGFVDPSYFTRFFRRTEGVTPSEFRRQAGTLPAGGS